LLLLAVLEGSEADSFVLLVEAFDALLTEESAEDVVELEGSEDLALLVEYEEVVDLLLLVLELSSFRPPDFELLAEAEADADVLELLEYSVGVYVGEDVLLLLLLELSSRRLEDLELLDIVG